jgi:hypothetical protein
MVAFPLARIYRQTTRARCARGFPLGSSINKSRFCELAMIINVKSSLRSSETIQDSAVSSAAFADWGESQSEDRPSYPRAPGLILLIADIKNAFARMTFIFRNG